MFSFYFKTVLSDTQVIIEPSSLQQRFQKKHELNDPVRFRCEQAKGEQGKSLDPTQEHVSPFYRPAGKTGQ